MLIDHSPATNEAFLSTSVLIVDDRLLWRVCRDGDVFVLVVARLLVCVDVAVNKPFQSRLSAYITNASPPSPTFQLRLFDSLTATTMSSLHNRPYSRPSMMDPTIPQASSTNQPPGRFLPSHVLTSRIAEKQAELDSLSQLRDLSAGLASQMENLESKLHCLADGTESMVLVGIC
jgi:DASH complex subunit Dad2